MSHATKHLRLDLLLLVIFSSSPLVYAEPDSNSGGRLALPAEQLVQQLGAPTFRERESAMSQLTQLGLPAFRSVQSGLNDIDPEIRFRCRSIFVRIQGLDRQRLINEFLSWSPSIDETNYPGWPQFKLIRGDNDPARRLYVSMLNDEWNFLAGVFHDRQEDPGNYVSARCMQIQNSGNYSRLNISPGTLAALLFVAGNDETFIQSPTTLLGFCSRPEAQAYFVRGEHQKLFKALLGQVVGRRLDAIAISQQLNLSLRYGLEEGTRTAREIVGDAAASGYARRTAILLLAKTGKPEDIDLLEPLLEDRSFSNRSQSVQLCDVVLAALIHMVGDDPKEYGFREMREDSVMLFYTPSLKLGSEQIREAAVKKWRTKHRAQLAAKP